MSSAPCCAARGARGVRLPRLRLPTPCPVRVSPQFRAKAGEPKHDSSPSTFKSHSLNGCLLLFTILRPLSRYGLLHNPLRSATLLTHHLHCERSQPLTTSHSFSDFRLDTPLALTLSLQGTVSSASSLHPLTHVDFMTLVPICGRVRPGCPS